MATSSGCFRTDECSPCVTDDEGRTIAGVMATGTYTSINLATADRAAVRVRDCAFRDPPGNLLRISRLPGEAVKRSGIVCRAGG
jgi:hypothetical protein